MAAGMSASMPSAAAEAASTPVPPTMRGFRSAPPEVYAEWQKVIEFGAVPDKPGKTMNKSTQEWLDKIQDKIKDAQEALAKAKLMKLDPVEPVVYAVLNDGTPVVKKVATGDGGVFCRHLSPELTYIVDAVGPLMTGSMDKLDSIAYFLQTRIGCAKRQVEHLKHPDPILRRMHSDVCKVCVYLDRVVRGPEVHEKEVREAATEFGAAAVKLKRLCRVAMFEDATRGKRQRIAEGDVGYNTPEDIARNRKVVAERADAAKRAREDVVQRAAVPNTAEDNQRANQAASAQVAADNVRLS